MDKKVTVLTPNGRRQNVRVTPNTILLQILEETCQKHGFDSDCFSLRHHNKEVGLTQMFRFSGLPNNCLLEMSPTDKKRVLAHVDICVQLEDGSRQQGQFVPSDNLWHVVEILSADAASSYESPVAIYMRQEIIGKENITMTSLKSLGITAGRAMIRLINKNPDELKIQANVYIAPKPKDVPKETGVDLQSSKAASNKQVGGGGGFAITKDLVQSLKKTDVSAVENEAAKSSEQMDTATTEASATKNVTNENEKPKYDWGSGSGRTIRSSIDEAAQESTKSTEHEAAEMEVEPEVLVIGERNAIVYSLEATQKQMENLPDSFFDLTVNDLKLVLRDLKKIATGSEEEPLLTEKLRELEENKTMLNKIALYKNCVIRIQFPDRYVLQGIFKPIDKVTNVMDFVRKFLIHPEAKFDLFSIPPKVVLPMEKTLLELDFVPTAVVHFALTDDEQPQTTAAAGEKRFIRAEFIEQLTTIEGAVYAANKMRISNRKSTICVENNNTLSTATQYESKSPGPSTGAIPKRPRNEDLKQAT